MLVALVLVVEVAVEVVDEVVAGVGVNAVLTIPVVVRLPIGVVVLRT